MQPFTGIDSSSGEAGEPGSARPAGRRNQTDVSYRERPFSDLVDEDKHALVGRKLAASLLGGYRMVVNDYDEDSLPITLHLAQILIYLILPATTIVSALAVPDDRWIAMAIGGALPFVINTITMLISKSLKGGDGAGSDSDSVSCFSKAGYLFLFPPKSGVGEVLLAAILTLVNGALMVYMIHPKTNGGDMVARIPQIVIMGLSSYSLFSQHCPEIAIYRDNDSELTWGSNHYQRSTYCSIFALILLVALEGGWASETFVVWVNNSFIIVYFLQVFGSLSHPVVTLLWALEQISVHLYGGTPRASDLRIVLSFVIQTLFISIPFIVVQESTVSVAKILMVLLAFVSSQNMLFSIGINVPFKKINERLQMLKNYADIVFARSNEATFSSRKENQGGSLGLFVYFAKTLILAGVLVLLAAIVENPEKDLALPRLLVIVSAALTVVVFLMSMASRHTVFRVVPCLHMQSGLVILKYMSGIMKILMTLCLATAYLMIIDATDALESVRVASQYDLVTVGHFFEVVFLFRMFARVFHDPFGASIESLALLQYAQASHLCLFAFLLHRSRVLLNQVVYILTSVVTAVKNKKQRFASQGLCFLLQFTILLPITVFVLLACTLLDTALIPFLGFAFFTIGYPKPQRGWSAINPVSANPSDSRSDGHLYQALLPELILQVQKMVSEDPFCFERDRFYLLKNEKMIVLIQVLEKGHNFLYFTMKGTELQETTVCHAEENGRMNDECELLFDKNERRPNFAFSLSPIKQISFDVYDDQKVSLAGVIESPDFEELVKKAFMYIVLLKLKDNFTQRLAERPQLFRVYKAELQEREMAPGRALLDRAWLSHLAFDYSAIEFRVIPASVAPAAMNFKNQVQPASAMAQKPGRPGAGAGRDASQQEPLTFLQRLEAENRLDNGGLPPPRARPHLSQASQDSGAQRRGGNGVAAAAVPVSQSVVPGPVAPGTSSSAGHGLPSIKKGSVRHGPTDDLDELEDMLDDLEGGGLDDLDDLLDDLGMDSHRPQQQKPAPAPAKSSGALSQQTGGQTGGSMKRVPSKAENLAGTFSDGLTRGPNPSSGSGLGEAASVPHLGESGETAGLPVSRSEPGRQAQGRSQTVNGSKDIEKFAVEAFHLLFGDQYQTTPLKMQALFRGHFKKTFDNRDFLDSQVHDVLHLKHIVLHSARLAFHWALESFIMGEMDVPSDHTAFESELKEMDREWFLGSEEYLWNSAIERHLPKLERLITKEGQHYAHRLILGQGKESTFSVFQFRREVIRGIWANLNMELLYYTNANDERFSIQAEKDILRNLLVQLAEIPLGYPVFSSGAQQAVDWPLEARSASARWSC